MFEHLIPADEALFFTRNDPDDPRMGDCAARDSDSFPGNARAVLVGVPQDQGVQRNNGRPGAAEGPDAIRAMFYRLTPYDLDTGRSIPDGFLFDAGNLYCYGDLEEIHRRLEEVVGAICRAGLIPIVLGGGHDVTYAAVSGVHAELGALGAVNVDSHLDVRPPVPSRNSGTSFRMLIDEEKLDPARFVELGIQPFLNAERHVVWLEEHGATVRSLDVVRRVGIKQTLTAALRVAAFGDRPFYGTLDIDGVRASDAPGVSAPSPQGLAADDLLAAARAFGRHPDCVGFDVVEVNPTFDVDGRTAKLAAHAVVRFLSGMLVRGDG